MHDLMTSILDVLALLLLAAGAAAAAFPAIGWASLAVAGVVLLVGSQVAARLSGREAQS
ncbi:MAG TPA: hypothetical protein VIQ30_01995 [Pseudonocardia sp.]